MADSKSKPAETPAPQKSDTPPQTDSSAAEVSVSETPAPQKPKAKVKRKVNTDSSPVPAVDVSGKFFGVDPEYCHPSSTRMASGAASNEDDSE